MPDLIATTFWRCAQEHVRTFASSGDPEKVYTARSDGFNVSCTCPGFRYHQKCRHTETVYREACKWNQEWDSRGLKPERDGHGELRCPACGGPLTTFVDMI